MQDSPRTTEELLFCFLTITVVAAASVGLVFMVLKFPLPGHSIPELWQKAIEKWRSAKSWGERLVVLLLIGGLFLRVGPWAAVAAFITGFSTTAAAMCGWDLPAAINQFRILVLDVYRLIHPDAGAAPGP